MGAAARSWGEGQDREVARRDGGGWPRDPGPSSGRRWPSGLVPGPPSGHQRTRYRRARVWLQPMALLPSRTLSLPLTPGSRPRPQRSCSSAARPASSESHCAGAWRSGRCVATGELPGPAQPAACGHPGQARGRQAPARNTPPQGLACSPPQPVGLRPSCPSQPLPSSSGSLLRGGACRLDLGGREVPSGHPEAPA